MRLKKQIFNIYTVIIFFAIPFFLFSGCLAPRQFFNILFFHFDAETLGRIISNISYEVFHLESFDVMQVVLPLLPMVGVGYFYSLKRGFFENAAARTGNYKNFVWKLILQSVFICAAVMYISYFITASAGALCFTNQTVDLGNSQRGLFTEFFGEMFSKENPYLYGLLEGIYRYIAFPAVYSLFGIAVSFCFKKPYMPILVPFVYYFAFGFAASYLKSPLRDFLPILRLIDTTSTVMGGAEIKMLFFVPFIPLIIPAVLSVIVINRKLKEDM